MATEDGLVAQQLRAMVNATVTRIDEDPWAAYELGFESINRARRFGVRPMLVFSVLNTSEIALRLGEWDRADAAIDSVLALDLDPSDRFLVLSRAGALALCRGQRDDPRLVQFREAARPQADHLMDLNMADLAMVEAFLDGDYPTAHRIAVDQARIDVLNGPSCLERAGRAALWMGDLEAARAVVREFHALGRSAAFPAAELAAIEAGVLALEGRREDALDRYRDVFRRYRDLRLTFDGAVVKLDAVRLLGIDTPEGASAAAEAREVFERLGARPYLECLDQLAAEIGSSRARRPRAHAGEAAHA